MKKKKCKGLHVGCAVALICNTKQPWPTRIFRRLSTVLPPVVNTSKQQAEHYISEILKSRRSCMHQLYSSKTVNGKISTDMRNTERVKTKLYKHWHILEQ